MLSAASAEIEQPRAELKLQLDYDEEGVPSIWGLSARVLQPLLGYTPGQLAPSYMSMLDQAGIDLLTAQTQGNGLFIYVNGRPLPNVAWSDEHLANALDLYAAMNEVSWVPNEAFVNMVRQVVLQVTNSDVVLSVSFP